MLGVARSAIPDADVVVWVVDASKMPVGLDVTIAGWITQSGKPAIIAMNKSDRLRPDQVQDHTSAYAALVPGAGWMLTIATTGHNVPRLATMVEAALPEGPYFYPPDQLTDQTDRMLATELVREAALHFLGAEVPHGVEVVLEEWTRRPNGSLFMACTFIVERASHKPLVLGAGGAMIRRIGTRSRHALEELLECKVFLELHVSVRANWRRDAAEVKRLGYG
jgi:GTP-binding protein Era